MPGHIFLIGFMGAGKTSTGQRLAARLGRPFTDLDRLVESEQGSAVADIFENSGEEGFRDAESSALASAVAAPPSVIACGGGVVLREENRAVLRREGKVVLLDVSPETALHRVGSGEGRPLLAGDAASTVRRLMSKRRPLYREAADVIVDADTKSPSGLADEIAEAVGTRERHIAVDVRDGRYEILVGQGLLARAGEVLRRVSQAAAAVLMTDDVVGPLYATALTGSLEGAGMRVTRIELPSGEESKSWARAGSVLEEMAAAGLDREGLVVALGGGVVGDLAGFCAASYMRGVRFAQVPTTLLAQVDSSIGGKTGVDLAAGKNLAGAFWQPVAVLSDTEVLRTLPEAEWRNGLAETAKTAVLAGQVEMGTLEESSDLLVSRDPDTVEEAVAACAAFKAAVVSADEREAGLRECLNYGHTLGHAIEKAAGYGRVPHGAAVAEGMRFAASLAEDVLGADAAWTARQESLLVALGLPALGALPDAAALRDAISSDKKARGGRIRFVLTSAPGRWEAREVEEGTLEEHLKRWTDGGRRR